LLRICRVLHLSPNDLLGWAEEGGDDVTTASLRLRITANLSALDPDMLKVVNTITTALVASAGGKGE
jgi:hypothetical protein